MSEPSLPTAAPRPSAPDDAGPLAALGRFEADLAGLPPRHPRTIGLWLLRGGMAGFLPCCVTGPAGPNICLAVAVAGLLLARPPLRGLSGLGWGLAFTIWVGLTAAIAAAHDPAHDPMSGKGLAYTWMVLVLGQIAYRHRPTLRLSLLALLGLVLASCLLAIAQFCIGLGDHGPFHLDRHGKRFEHGVGFIGLHLTQGPVMAVMGLVLFAGGRAGLLGAGQSLLGGGTALLAVFLSTARLAYFGAAAGWTALLGLRRRGALVPTLAAVLALVGVALLLLLWLQPVRTQHLLRGEDGRWPIWHTSLLLVEDHPLVGVGGPEAFKLAYHERFAAANPGWHDEFASTGAPHAHNSLLEIAAEHGLPAVALYCGLLAAVLVRLRRQHQEGSWGLALGAGVIASMLVAGMFENLAGHAASSDTQFAALAVALCLPTPARRASQEAPASC